MLLVHIFFWVCLLLVGMSVYYWVRLVRGRPELDPKGNPLPWWVWATFIGFGVLGMVASAPGLFFEQPYWLTDKIYWVVEKFVGLFT
jgi:hypothetical protein